MATFFNNKMIRMIAVVFAALCIVHCGDSKTQPDGKTTPDLSSDTDNAGEADSIGVFIETGQTLVMEIDIYVFHFEGEVEITAYDNSTGDFSATIDFDDLIEPQDVSGHISGDSLTLDDITINHSMASGTATDFVATVDQEEFTAEGQFRFIILESRIYEDFEGQSIGGTFRVHRFEE